MIKIKSSRNFFMVWSFKHIGAIVNILVLTL